MSKTVLPISDPKYWKARLALHESDAYNIHRSIYDVSFEEWRHIQHCHEIVLRSEIKPHMVILDAGCGYGALMDILPELKEYIGIDIASAFIRYAKKYVKRPNFRYLVRNLKNLPFKDNHFDISICRSMEGMVRQHLGDSEWNAIERELLRVSKRLLKLGYSNPRSYLSIDSQPHPEQGLLTHVVTEHSRLVYRVQLGNVCQIEDIWVEASHRNQGLATEMHRSLFNRGFNTVFGFSKSDNTAIINLQKKIGFNHFLVPNFYGGSHAVMAYRNRSTIDNV